MLLLQRSMQATLRGALHHHSAWTLAQPSSGKRQESSPEDSCLGLVLS